jgi:TrmH family RNA methyltransferase
MSQVSSLQNPAIKLLRSLADKKHRRETGLFVAEGRKVLGRARSEGWEPEYYVSRWEPEPWGGAQLVKVEDKVMAALSSQSNPPDVLAVFKQRLAPSVRQAGTWVALEDLRDPGNLGGIIRTADAVGAAGVILTGDSCDPWGPECVRATMGSIFGVALARLSKEALISLCREWPGDVVGTAMNAATNYRRAYAAPTLFIMGSEGAGLSAGLAAACSVMVGIPMPGKTESLNVAIAAALMLYETVNT